MDLIETRTRTLKDSSIFDLTQGFQGYMNEIVKKLRSQMGAIMVSFKYMLKAVHEAIYAPKCDMVLCKPALAGGAMVLEEPKVKVLGPSNL